MIIKYLPWIILVSGGLVFASLPADFFIQHDFPLCLWQYFFHIPCPGCGTLRALTALFHGDLQTAWNFNPLAYFWVVLLFVYPWLDQRLSLTNRH